MVKGERGGVVVEPQTPEREVGGSIPTSPVLCPLAIKDTFIPRKVLVIPRKWCLRPNMTEKLFTRTLSLNKTKTKSMVKSCCISVITANFGALKL